MGIFQGLLQRLALRLHSRSTISRPPSTVNIIVTFKFYFFEASINSQHYCHIQILLFRGLHQQSTLLSHSNSTFSRPPSTVNIIVTFEFYFFEASINSQHYCHIRILLFRGLHQQSTLLSHSNSTFWRPPSTVNIIVTFEFYFFEASINSQHYVHIRILLFRGLHQQSTLFSHSNSAFSRPPSIVNIIVTFEFYFFEASINSQHYVNIHILLFRGLHQQSTLLSHSNSTFSRPPSTVNIMLTFTFYFFEASINSQHYCHIRILLFRGLHQQSTLLSHSNSTFSKPPSTVNIMFTFEFYFFEASINNQQYVHIRILLFRGLHQQSTLLSYSRSTFSRPPSKVNIIVTFEFYFFEASIKSQHYCHIRILLFRGLHQ